MNIPHRDWILAKVTLKSCTIKLQERKPTNVLNKLMIFLSYTHGYPGMHTAGL